MKTTATASPSTTVPLRLAPPPSARWTPNLRRRTNELLFGYAGADDVTHRFDSPRDCAEYYSRYASQHPLAELEEYLDELDEHADIHAVADQHIGETSLNGFAVENAITMVEASSTAKPIRTVMINGREYPRMKSEVM